MTVPKPRPLWLFLKCQGSAGLQQLQTLPTQRPGVAGSKFQGRILRPCNSARFGWPQKQQLDYDQDFNK